MKKDSLEKDTQSFEDSFELGHSGFESFDLLVKKRSHWTFQDLPQEYAKSSKNVAKFCVV